jgi:DNA-binding transcriptional ArsR family regulator
MPKRANPVPLSKLPVLKALASDKRLLILHYLKEPTRHFPRQVDGDLVKDGVCADFIREKLGISAATATQHLKILAAAGLVRGKRIKQWTFFKRCDDAIASVRQLSDEL